MSPSRRLAFFFSLLGCAAAALVLWYQAKAEVAATQIEQVLRHSPSAIIVCARDGKVRFANERLQAYTGFTLADLQGPDGLQVIIPADIYPRHNVAFHRAAVEPTADRMNYRKVLPVRCKDGKLIQAVITVSTIAGPNRQPEFFAFITPLPEIMVPVPAAPADFKLPPPPSQTPVTQPAQKN